MKPLGSMGYPHTTIHSDSTKVKSDSASAQTELRRIKKRLGEVKPKDVPNPQVELKRVQNRIRGK